jgi:type I restriction enzyme S subunit
MVSPPGVVTGRKGILGKVFFIEEPFWPHDTTLWVKDFKGNHPGYVALVLKNFHLERLDAATSVPTLNRNNLGGYPIPHPRNKTEQRAIAVALSDADALIESLGQLIAKKRDLKQAAMQQLLTGKQRLPGFTREWEGNRFGQLFQFLPTAHSPRSDFSDFGSVGYIHYGDIHTTTSAFLDCAHAKLPLIEQTKVAGLPFLEDGDLVMADASEDYAGIGKCVEVFHVSGGKIVAGLHTFLLRGNKERLADGFKGYLQFIPSVKASLIKLATGISVYGVSKNNVRSIEVSLPPLPEQTAIAAVLSDMDAELAAMEQRRDKICALKQGMMQELLTGKTRLV